MPETPTIDSDNPSATQEGADRYVLLSTSDPDKIIDMRWMLREEASALLEKAARHLDIALHCMSVPDDVGAVRAVILAGRLQSAAAVHLANLRRANVEADELNARRSK